MKLVLLSVTLLIFSPSFSQPIKEEILTFPGIIESIDGNLKFIVVNEVQIMISPDTKIVDEKGNTLSLKDLKPKLHVTIEALRNFDRFSAKKIVVKTIKRKP